MEKQLWFWVAFPAIIWTVLLQQTRAQEPFRLETWWEEYLNSLVDCEFKYTIEFGNQKVNHQFAKSGRKFYHKTFGHGSLMSMVSFDGKTFYSLGSKNTHNVLGHTVFNRLFTAKFQNNPLYLPLSIVSEGGFGHFKSNFYPNGNRSEGSDNFIG